ncbi:unnamed protein product [Nezara viridula]|uniref:Uncharacterized protein n=1 Tax=Nezara viridula TaxID=85310 RepID=A0A9P0MXH5_NEZVI|nr:unnamed protein product [Nezara viridula]
MMNRGIREEDWQGRRRWLAEAKGHTGHITQFRSCLRVTSDQELVTSWGKHH